MTVSHNMHAGNAEAELPSFSESTQDFWRVYHTPSKEPSGYHDWRSIGVAESSRYSHTRPEVQDPGSSMISSYPGQRFNHVQHGDVDHSAADKPWVGGSFSFQDALGSSASIEAHLDSILASPLGH